MLQWQDTISIQLCTKALDQKLDMGVLREILLSLHQQLRVTLPLNLGRCRRRRIIQNNLDLHWLPQVLRKTISQGLPVQTIARPMAGAVTTSMKIR